MNNQILEHFKYSDVVMYEYLKKHFKNMQFPQKSTNYFLSLCRSIASQQLSGKAANSIFNRLLNDIGKDTFTESEILKYTPDRLREFGFSNSKSNYLLNIARASKEGLIDFKTIDNLTDEQVIENLIQIKGVGRWTAQMFLLFTLARADIFSIGDLGLRKGIMKMYSLREVSEKEMISISEKWAPYRSYASIALWHILDNR